MAEANACRRQSKSLITCYRMEIAAERGGLAREEEKEQKKKEERRKKKEERRKKKEERRKKKEVSRLMEKKEAQSRKKYQEKDTLLGAIQKVCHSTFLSLFSPFSHLIFGFLTPLPNEPIFCLNNSLKLA